MRFARAITFGVLVLGIALVSSCSDSGDDAKPPCANGAQDGDETDVDCGGGCAPCALGQGCDLDEDCAAGRCLQGVCDDAPLRLDERLASGQVRAGVIRHESELLEGPEAHGWLGDLKLYNDRVAFVIQGLEDVARGWAPYSGTLIDADAIRPEGEPGHEIFTELMLNLDLTTLRPDTAELINDGRGGEPAVVRVTGVPRGIPLVDGALMGTVVPKDVAVTTDYILEPDVSYLRISTAVRSLTGSSQTVHLGDLVLNGDEAIDFAYGAGVSPDGIPTGEQPYYGGFDERACNLYTGAEGSISTLLSIEGITPLEIAKGKATTAEPGLVVERLLFVDGGGMDGCVAAFEEYLGRGPLGTLSGTVRDAAGTAEAGASVFARDTALEAPEDVVNQTFTDADGHYALQLPAGAYGVSVRAAGRDELTGSDAAALTAGGAASLDLTVPAAAWLEYACTGADREGAATGASPCRVTLQAGADAPMGASIDRATLTFDVGGAGRVAVPPGEWTVTLSRGWERSIHRESVTLVAGQTTKVSGVLRRQVDTGGFLAADLHSHSGRSPETHYPVEDKLAVNICSGVEVMVASDHDCQCDFSGFLDSLGQRQGVDLTPYLLPVAGIEVSPFGNHFTTFAVETHPTGWNCWWIPWTKYDEDGIWQREMEFPEIWPGARAQGGEIINVAHPTGDKGWWSRLGFDPPDTMPLIADLPADRWSPDFDTIELLNSGAVSRMLDDNLPIWSHFNNQGFFRTASAVSDAHLRTDPQGFGMTYIAASTDVPGEVNLDTLLGDLKDRHAVIGAGLFVRIDVAGAGPGELVSQTAPFDVAITVQAADWIEAEQAQLLENGEVVATLPLQAPGVVDAAHPALRLDERVSVTPAADSWYAVLATGPGAATLAPLVSARPVGLTNAVQVDVDGDGSFTAPLSR